MSAIADDGAQAGTGRWAKRWLIAVLAGYAACVAWYFLVSPAEFLKYFITIGGILLGTVIREAARKEWKALRLVAICVPVAAVAFVQAHDSYQSSQRRAAEALDKGRTRAREVEGRLREEFVLQPRDAIRAIRGADRGFLVKADRLRFRANLGNTPDDREIARLRKLEASYRAAARDFAKLVKPQYDQILKLDERSSEDEQRFMARLRALVEQVASLAAQHGNAGLYNHAGALAQAARQGERALAYFYQAHALEPDHLPAYESLGYALWIFNLDAYGAWKYAAQGLNEAELQRARLANPEETKVLSPFLDAMEARLKLQYAYFSAVQYENETQARGFAGELLRSSRADAEYQDTQGYVLMRFAKDASELEEAKSLFRQALQNPEAERVTKQLAAKHLEEANETLRRLRGT